ncbi:MAG TPA: hypothetical protein VM638_03750, partial [Actinomycetota bacterium]|nr:hypothetical protein [Actinomycetota bacterium]
SGPSRSRDQSFLHRPPPPPAPAEGGEGTTDPGTGTALNDQREIVILSANAQQSEVIKHAQTQVGSSMSLVLRSPGDFRDPATTEPIIPAPEDTTGITLSVLVNEYDVLVPQVIEALLPDREPGQPAAPEEETP